MEKETGRWWGKLYDAGNGLGWSLGMMALAICLGRNQVRGLQSTKEEAGIET